MRPRAGALAVAAGALVGFLWLGTAVAEALGCGRTEATLVADCLIALALGAWWALSKRGRAKGRERGPEGADVPALAALALLLAPVWLVGQAATTSLALSGAAGQGAAELSSAAPSGAAMTLLALGAAPVAEELLCRGLVFWAASRAFGAAGAALVQAAVFSLMHGVPVQWPAVALFALFQQAVLSATGRMRLCVASHVAYNAAALGLSLSVPAWLLSPAFWAPAMALFGAVCLALAARGRRGAADGGGAPVAGPEGQTPRRALAPSSAQETWAEAPSTSPNTTVSP